MGPSLQDSVHTLNRDMHFSKSTTVVQEIYFHLARKLAAVEALPILHLVIYTSFHLYPNTYLALLSLRLQLPLGLLVVLGRVDAVLVVVDKVEPRDRAEHERRVPALAGRHALQMRAQPAHAVQGLALLDLVHHLPHVHLDLAGVLGGAVESDCFRIVSILHRYRLWHVVDVRQDRW